MELIASRKKDKKQSYTKRKEVSVFLNIAVFHRARRKHFRNGSQMKNNQMVTKYFILLF